MHCYTEIPDSPILLHNVLSGKGEEHKTPAQ